jgi:protein AroM
MTTPSRLGLLTIGQSPRSDLSGAITQALPADVAVLHAGVLDEMSREDIAAEFPVSPATAPLITRLRDGSAVSLGAAAVESGLQRKVDSLEQQGADAIVVLCTGRFEALRARHAQLIEPDHVVTMTVASLIGHALLGIIVPLPDQVDQSREKWKRQLSRSPVFAAASPYDDDPGALIHAACLLKKQGARALVLDCMGYSALHKRALQSSGIDLPIFVSAVVTGAAVSLMF